MKSIEIGERGKRPEPSPEQERFLATQPDVDLAVLVAARAFRDLDTCRPIGMIAGLIPWTAIVTWCDVEGLDAEARRILTAAIRYVDVEQYEKRAKNQPKPRGN